RPIRAEPNAFSTRWRRQWPATQEQRQSRKADSFSSPQVPEQPASWLRQERQRRGRLQRGLSILLELKCGPDQPSAEWSAFWWPPWSATQRPTQGLYSPQNLSWPFLESRSRVPWPPDWSDP